MNGKRDPIWVDACIKCGKPGRVNPFTPSGKITEFHVIHGERDYKWGTALKIAEQVTADLCDEHKEEIDTNIRQIQTVIDQV